MRQGAVALSVAVVLFALGPLAHAASAIALPPGQLPPTIAAGAPLVVTREVLVLVPQGPAVRAEEIVTAVNQSKATLTHIALPLPAGAVGAVAGSGVVAGPRGMGLAQPLAPGATAQASFRFVLSYAGGHVWLPVRYPTGLLAVLVPQGRWAMAGPGFQASGPVALGQGLRLAGYTTVGPTAGATLPLRLVRRPWWATLGWPVWGPVAGLGALVAGVLGARAWRRRLERRSQREGALIDAVANLDAAFASGEMDESSYRARRQELLEGLGATHVG